MVTNTLVVCKKHVHKTYIHTNAVLVADAKIKQTVISRYRTVNKYSVTCQKRGNKSQHQI